MKLLSKISSFLNRACDVLAVGAAALLIAIFLLVNTEVIVRSFTGYSIIWVIEICQYALLFITFLGTAWVLKRDGHIKIELLVSWLNPRHRVIANVFTSISCTIICLVVTWYSAKVTWVHYQGGYILSGSLMPPSFIIQCIIPIGSFMLFSQFLKITHGHLRRLKTLWKGAIEQE